MPLVILSAGKETTMLSNLPQGKAAITGPPAGPAEMRVQTSGSAGSIQCPLPGTHPEVLRWRAVEARIWTQIQARPLEGTKLLSLEHVF